MTLEDRRLFAYLPVIFRLMGPEYRRRLTEFREDLSVINDWPEGRLVSGGETLRDKLARIQNRYLEIYAKQPSMSRIELDILFYLLFRVADTSDLGEQKETWKTIFELLDGTPAQIMRMT